MASKLNINLFDRLLPILKSTALARIADNGQLLEASAEYKRLLPVEVRDREALNAGRYFLQPSFNDLKEEVMNSSSQCYEGLFNIGSWNGETSTLNGIIYRQDNNFILVCEHDIRDFHEVNKQMLNLNEALANTHHELSLTLRKTKKLEEVAHQNSITDVLTGVGNRRQFEEGIRIEMARAIREKKSLGIVMADLDHFKAVNDTYGHDAGDRVLESFGKLIRDSIRPFDLPARFGGEEFIILMPGAGVHDAAQLAERIRTSLETLEIASCPFKLTASFGVTELQKEDSTESILRRVDSALYQAKEAGRNKVTAAD